MRRRIAFLALLSLSALSALQAQQYAEQNGWSFNNFSDATYSWDIFRDTFIGIPPSYDPWSSAFDVLFYDQVYKDKLGSSGNCYGISLMSLMMLKKGGHLGYCLPVPQYSGDILGGGGPSDPALRRSINIMHGHQVNLPTLQWIMDIIAQNKNRDGAFAFSQWQATKLQNDLALVSITKTLNPSDGGHTMVAYDAQDLGAGNRRIYVDDPNRTWADSSVNGRDWYTSGQNFIQLTGSSWSFTMAGGEVWSGSPSSGGNIMITPASVTGPHSRSPSSMGTQIIGMVLTQLLLTGAGAQVEQVTDANGKRLFKPGTFEIDTDPSSGMMNMVPFIPSDLAARGEARQLFFQLGGSGGSLTLQVRGGNAGYTLWAGGPRSQVMVRSRGGSGADQIAFSQLGSANAKVHIENRRGAEEYEVQFVQPIQPREKLHVLRATRLFIPEGESVALAVADNGRALSIESHSAAIRYDLELQLSTPRGAESLTKQAFTQEAGQLRTVRPRDWSELKNRDVIDETHAPPRRSEVHSLRPL